MVLISFVNLQKIHIFWKFGRCSSKIEPAMPISILRYQRAWHTFKICHTLQIFKNDSFFYRWMNKWYYYHFLIIPTINSQFKKNRISYSAWFLSYTFQIFRKCVSFQDAQMVLVPYFAISYGFNFGRNAKAFQSILE